MDCVRMVTGLGLKMFHGIYKMLMIYSLVIAYLTEKHN